MNIMVSGKNLDVTAGLRDHVEKKVGKIARYFNNPLEAQVTMQTERGRHIVEITMPAAAGLILRAEVASNDMYASVDQAVDKLERQIRKYKTRINRKARQQQAELLLGPDGPPEADEEDARVVKTKRFYLKPMDVEEAILQMNLLDHDFFVFRDAESHEVNVLYKRKDGNYGLIDPRS